MKEDLTENLFSYGTLQKDSVQIQTFGRLLQGESDTLIGYRLEMLDIKDKGVIATSGIAKHPIIQYSGIVSDTIQGVVFKITKNELAKADRYEVEDYKRILVELKSGIKAWVYISK